MISCGILPKWTYDVETCACFWHGQSDLHDERLPSAGLCRISGNDTGEQEMCLSEVPLFQLQTLRYQNALYQYSLKVKKKIAKI